MRTGLPRAALAAALVASAAVAPDARGAGSGYAWNLSNATGALKTSGAFLTWDRHGKELFLVESGIVRVFSRTGMEIYSFGDDARLGRVYSVAPLDTGDLLVLSSFGGGQMGVVRTNFRGEPVGRLELKGVPPELSEDFHPNGIGYAAGKVFLLDKGAMRLVVTDVAGEHLASYDLSEMIIAAETADGSATPETAKLQRAATGIRGFSVDAAGNVLFTVQPLFRAYVVTADGRLQSFGKKGSGKGSFNVVGPIAADEHGNVFVGDLLRSVVIMFDKDLRYVREFGSRGHKPGQLVVPNELAAGDGKVFVSQYAQRGVSVFRVSDSG
jgi:hypothetical protein